MQGLRQISNRISTVARWWWAVSVAISLSPAHVWRSFSASAKHELIPLKRWLGRGIWAYAACLIVISVFLHTSGDTWWLATVFLYGPRWVCGLPLIVLVPLAGWLRRRYLVLLAGTACLVVGPIMGLCVPRPALGTSVSAGPRIRVLTINLQGRRVNSLALGSFLTRTQPDVLMFQERSRMAIPGWGVPLHVMLERMGWHVAQAETLMIASRYPILEQLILHGTDICGDFDGARKGASCVACKLETPQGMVQVFNFHGSTPRRGLEALIANGRAGLPAFRCNLRMRRAESKAISDLVQLSREPTIVAGDFNLAAESVIFQECWSLFDDAYREAGFGFGQTKFEIFWGTRIDHILVDGNWNTNRCWVGPDLGSDHRPLLADLSPRSGGRWSMMSQE